MATRGKRAGPKRRTRFNPAVLLLTIGITAGVIAWGYLVKAAVDFGIQARYGNTDAWLYLGLASLGAVACLFIGLMLIARLVRALGITSPPSSSSSSPPSSEPEQPRPVGGRRAAR